MTAENNNNQVTTTLTTGEGGNLRKGVEVVPPLPKKIGRPTKLTPELQEKICKYVANGNYFTTACQAVGISYQTYLNWLERAKAEEAATKTEETEEATEGHNGGGLYLDFFEALKIADAQAEAERVSRIREAGIGGQVIKRITRTKRDGTTEIEEQVNSPQWLADITFAERRWRERFGRPAPVGITIDEHKEISITHVEYHLGPGQALPQIVEGEAVELETEK